MIKERHFFPGSNTSKGFHSFFQYILPLKDAKRLFYIKGGPGTGKSYFMKKIGQTFADKGYSIEYFHCSSDNESLDAVLIKELGIVLLDGTAPHINDPKVPGALDEIIDFGVCLDEKKLSLSKNDIMNVDNKIKDSFKRAYSYFAAARSVHDDWSYQNNKALDRNKLKDLKKKLKDSILETNLEGLGEERHLFATAFTPNGIISYVDTIYDSCEKVYVLKGGPGTGKTEVLSYLKEEALINGHNVEVFHDPLIPERIEHLVLPELSIAILTSNEINKQSFIGIEIDMETLLDKDHINSASDFIKESQDTFYALLEQGLKNLVNCKKLHDEIEQFYVDNIDFKCRDHISEGIMNRLMKY